MDDRDARERDGRENKKTDLASSSQFLMIVVVTVIALLVLAFWRPWVTKTVNGVPDTVVATASP